MTKGAASAAYIPLTQKGANNGVASLDSGGKVPVAQLPNSIMEYKGAYNPTTNTPKLADTSVAASKIIQDLTYTAVTAGNAGNDITIAYTDPGAPNQSIAVTVVGSAISVSLATDGDSLITSTATLIKTAVDNNVDAAALVSIVVSGTGSNVQTAQSATNLEGGLSAGNAGDVYRVTAAGSHDFGSGSITFVIGDYIIYNGTIWEKSHSGADAVVSVNSQTGAVVLDADDISDAETTKKFYTATQARSDLIAASISDGDTTHAPDGNSVFDALAGKSDTSHNHSGVYAPVSHSHAISDVTDLSTTLSGKVNVSDQYKSYTNKNAGTISANQFVYVKSTVAAPGEVDLAKADASATCAPKIGIVYDATIAADAAGNITIKRGTRVAGFIGLTIGAKLYLSPETAGGYTQTCPSTVGQFVVILGEALSATEIEFCPEAAVEIAS
jgi:hypothetical protein